MASLLDVIFSMILGGMLLVTVAGANDVAMENSNLIVGDKMVQESAVSISLYLDGEMRNMGFGVPDTEQVVLFADSTKVIYRVSLPPFGKIDTVSFYLGSTSDLAATPNTEDRYLYRTEDGGASIPVAVVTYLRFRYLDRADTLMPFPITGVRLAQVFKVEVTTEVQNSYALYRPQGTVQAGQANAMYSSSIWNQTRLAAQNIGWRHDRLKKSARRSRRRPARLLHPPVRRLHRGRLRHSLPIRRLRPRWG